MAGGRPGYEIFDTRQNTRRTQTLDLVNRIRERVDAWRAADFPGVTSVTRGLLDHWRDRSTRDFPFYFCQHEAIETLIWWVEAPSDFKQGSMCRAMAGPGSACARKMATGTGKTLVMGMIVAWQTLNAVTYPKERGRSRSRSSWLRLG